MKPTDSHPAPSIDAFVSLAGSSRFVQLTAVILTVLAATGCTDANIYSEDRARAQADRVALQGRVCTEDPAQAQFPVRLIVLVDQADGPQYAPGRGDSASFARRRTEILQEFARTTLREPRTEMAVIGYGGRPRKLAPSEGNFTDSRAAVRGALQTLDQSQTCSDDGNCRDYRGAIDLAQTLIEGDLAEIPTGLRVLTQYAVVMINAGPQDRPTHPDGCCSLPDAPRKCCPDGNSSCARVQRCQRETDQARIETLRETVRERGAAGLRFHTVHLAAHQADGNSGVDDRLGSTMKQMAVAGGGTYQRFNAPGGLDDSAFDVLGLRTTLHAKRLVATNHNALPTAEGLKVDSDADGLPDEREREGQTSATRPDTDTDGVTDRVELLVGQSPTAPDEPRVCRNLEPAADRDQDGLTDCDERLLGTEPTLVDTDGDGISDRTEVFNGTDYLAHDADDDADGDGVSNGTELQQRTDPRSTDLQRHLSEAYRYTIDDQGFVTDLFAEDPDQITGLEIRELSDGTTPGIGTLRYFGDRRQLSWRDARDDQFGPPVDVNGAGTIELPSNSFAPAQGQEGRKITVEVSPNALPPDSRTESIRVTSRRRQCLEYTIRNIQLMETAALPGGQEAGHNDIVLYFSQAPDGQLLQPGPFRRAQIPVRFDPPDRREPSDPILEIRNREFVRPPLR